MPITVDVATRRLRLRGGTAAYDFICESLEVLANIIMTLTTHTGVSFGEPATVIMREPEAVRVLNASGATLAVFTMDAASVDADLGRALQELRG